METEIEKQNQQNNPEQFEKPKKHPIRKIIAITGLIIVAGTVVQQKLTEEGIISKYDTDICNEQLSNLAETKDSLDYNIDSITAADLLSDYAEDEDLANSTYTDKYFKISGKISRVYDGSTYTEPNVLLKDPSDEVRGSLQCSFDSCFDYKALELQDNDEIVVEGIISRYYAEMAFGDNCIIITTK